jgi:hypothetical protein
VPPPDRALIVQEFESSVYPGGKPSPAGAWLGIYQVLWWYEHGFLHIREANDLKKPPWQARAKAAEALLAASLGIDPGLLGNSVDRMMRLPRWSGNQRQNPLGKGFRVLVSEVLTRWGDPRFDYREEVLATNWFPGISLPGRSEAPKMDVLAVDKQKSRPATVLSCKWSIRHDRISDPTNECTAYKAAAIQHQIMHLRYYVVTNEMDPRRLDKVLTQPCVDCLVHVHLDLVKHIFPGLTGIMNAAHAAGRLLDLEQLVQQTHNW